MSGRAADSMARCAWRGGGGAEEGYSARAARVRAPRFRGVRGVGVRPVYTGRKKVWAGGKGRSPFRSPPDAACPVSTGEGRGVSG
jgi:hypothetical protein